MMSQIPIDLKKINKAEIDREILRTGIIAELDAINLYNQMSELTDNKNIKIILADIAKEEKTHVGEFQAMLLEIDSEQVTELKKGKAEVEELIK